MLSPPSLLLAQARPRQGWARPGGGEQCQWITGIGRFRLCWACGDGLSPNGKSSPNGKPGSRMGSSSLGNGSGGGGGSAK